MTKTLTSKSTLRKAIAQIGAGTLALAIGTSTVIAQPSAATRSAYPT